MLLTKGTIRRIKWISRRGGFTLVEMLVVIAILVALAAILFPVFSKARAAAKESSCAQNLTQIGLGLQLYTADFDDVFPRMLDAVDRTHPEIWDTYPGFEGALPHVPMMQIALSSYVRSQEVFHCPADTGSNVVDEDFPMELEAAPSDFATFGTSYLYRTELTVKDETSTSLPYPAATNVLFDEGGHWHGAGAALSLDDDLPTADGKLIGYKYNVLFSDLHAKSQTYAQLQAAWGIAI